MERRLDTYVLGKNIFTDKGEILFEIDKLRDKRTMIFAQSGFGKTNFVKVLLNYVVGSTAYGKLIFDLNGEYFIRSERAKTYGWVMK